MMMSLISKQYSYLSTFRGSGHESCVVRKVFNVNSNVFLYFYIKPLKKKFVGLCRKSIPIELIDKGTCRIKDLFSLQFLMYSIDVL